MHKRIAMKTFKLVPLVLAGFCGYLHTVINRRFDEIGDLMGSASSLAQGSSLMDAPVRKALDELSASSSSSSSGAALGLQQEAQSATGLTPAQRVNMENLLGPAEDKMETGKEQWDSLPIIPKDNAPPLLANSDEYQQMLLRYTMNLLPNHLDPSASKANAAGEGTANKQAETETEQDDLNHPKPYQYHQVDMIVPASGQDDRLYLFADRLGVALKNYNEWYEGERKPAVLRRIKHEQEVGLDKQEGGEAEDNNLIPNKIPDMELKFRLLVTRYPQDAQKTPQDFEALQDTLSEKTTLPKDQIKLIRVGVEDSIINLDNDNETPLKKEEFHLKFNRAHARNVLHQNACHEDDCIVTAFDVDMQVLPIFFHRALLSVTPHAKAYFPIVFSEFNPATVQLVQDFLRPQANSHKNKDNNGINGDVEEEAEDERDPMLQPFSHHRGLWRDFGYGMYVLAGSDAQRFRFNEEHQGWGHEDNDFYKLVHNNMRVDRQREHGLIHAWHTKNCAPGRDIITQQQWLDCLNSRDVMEGSALGLLLRPALKTYKLEDFPGLPQGEKEIQQENEARRVGNKALSDWLDEQKKEKQKEGSGDDENPNQDNQDDDEEENQNEKEEKADKSTAGEESKGDEGPESRENEQPAGESTAEKQDAADDLAAGEDAAGINQPKAVDQDQAVQPNLQRRLLEGRRINLRKQV